MKNGLKVSLILAGIILVMTGILVVDHLLDKVPENDISTVGNTASNINNGGLFAQQGDTVYFSNSFDHGYLYSMNKNETELKKISSSPVRNILTGGDYLYYYMDTSESNGTGLGYVVRTYGIFRSSTNGKKVKCLDREASVTMQLCGNYIYYQRYNNVDYTKIYRVNINGNDPELVTDTIINPVAYNNGIIYYNGTEKDHYLYALNTENNTSYTVFQGNLWYPSYRDGYIYYMDVSSKYRLCRYNLNSQEVEILTNDRVDTFNVGDYKIYYQKNDNNEPALMRMNLDGSEPEMVAAGNYTDINQTSEYVYFKKFGDDITTYHTSAYGSINVSTFTSALDAAMANSK